MLDPAELRRAAAQLGLSGLGVTSAEPFPEHVRAVRARLLEGTLAQEASASGEGISEAQAWDPSASLKGARSVLCLSLGYLTEDAPSPASAGPMGRLSRLHRWDSVGELLRRRDALMAYLGSKGWRCAAPEGFPLKAASARAGLGSFGKNSNIQTLDDGSWCVLGVIVTDAHLVPDDPMGPRCGSCRRCMGVCPTKAIVAPYVVDGRRCLNHLLASATPVPREFRPAVGDRLSGCDACQEVCPRNWYVVPRRPEGLPGLGPRELPLLPLLRGDLKVPPIGLRGHAPSPLQLRRNAALALGNSGWSGALDALVAALADADAGLRSCSAWALGRLGGAGARAALIGAQSEERDPGTAEEIALALAEL